MLVSVILLKCISLVASKVYFHETFDDSFESRWVYSKDTSVTHGVFHRVQRKHCSDSQFGIKSQNDSAYYHMSAKLDSVLETTAKPLYLQYVAHYEQNIDCGGAYLKLFETLDQEKLLGTSPYSIMVGPDVCGYSTKVIHLIISHNETNYELKEKVTFDSDIKAHLIELFIGTDKKFHLKIDGQIKKEGNLEDSYDYLPPKKIDDPNDKKPEDWVDEEMMDDPEDKKPEDWDDRKHIPDPNASKPEDWNDEKDGEWERDMIDNPAYKGEWSPKKISNPAFKGVWAPKQIDNPDYRPDSTFAHFKLGFVGFDLWTVKSGTVFDDIYITDDAKEAETHAKTVMEELDKLNVALEEEQKASARAEEPAAEEPSGEEASGESGDADSEGEGESAGKDEHEDL